MKEGAKIGLEPTKVVVEKIDKSVDPPRMVERVTVEQGQPVKREIFPINLPTEESA